MLRLRPSLLVLLSCLALASLTLLEAQERNGLLDLFGAGNEVDDETLDQFEDPESIMCWVELPRSAQVDDELVMTITIENARSDEDCRLSRIDIEDTFMEGFKLVSVEPKPRHQADAFGIVSLEIPVDVETGATRKYEVKLEPQKPGVFIGDVDLYEGAQWLSRAAQIRITE